MKILGEGWTAEDVKRVYKDSTLDEALRSRKSALSSFFNIIGKVINNKQEE